ncbi:hypothetical protein [Bradyrhizobium sp. CCBAU 45321]|uniref:hypothetical protein n=1 Tax=Bradyrhizobium sp. CCBAU 45321 TaxID=1641878 RepID=UPI0023029A07|nr:hypothetical protein [Bradyrhizobium sp. CCBAU 45321]
MRSIAGHRLRTVHVGANERDVGSGAQDCEGFVGIQRFQRRVAGVFHHANCAPAEHHLVFYDENEGWNA